jgi:hypothetical protein
MMMERIRIIRREEKEGVEEEDKNNISNMVMTRHTNRHILIANKQIIISRNIHNNRIPMMMVIAFPQ